MIPLGRDAGFTQYLQWASRYPLLTKNQEILLARQVQAWVGKEHPTPREVRIGRRAYEKLIKCNLRLVVSIAKRYAPRIKKSEIMDVVQEGNLGLAHGVKKFDPERGYALSTYIYWWVRQAITRYLNCNDRIIRLPIHAVEALNKIRVWRPLFIEEHGRPPTLEECAEYTGMSVNKIEEYLRRCDDAGSLDHKLKDDTEATLLDMIADEASQMQAEDVHDEERVYLMLRMVDNLPEHEKEVIKGLFEIDGTKLKTLKDLGKELGFSRERARQKREQALRRLRVMSRNYGEFARD